MQGTWLVSVKMKNASFPQQFEISNAVTGNGVYAGTHSGEITVTDSPGSSWAITIRNNPGTGFRSSQIKLKFPTIVGGFHQFDIQSNDAGGDADFDDLVLTCRTPVSANDHLIYGHVSDYAGRCIFNPCFYPYLVLDTPIKLQEALRIPKLRDYLKEIRPELLVRPPFPPDPIGPVSLSPHPLPPRDFTPMVIPFPGELATPLKNQFLVRTETKTLNLLAGKKQAAASESIAYQSIKSIVPIEHARYSIEPAQLSRRASLESIIARYRFCDSDPLANIRVRFQEYDRTEAEKSGAPYTGEGARTNLGSTFTDDFGNYIFRFTTVPNDQTDEIINDLAPGEDAFVQSAPDVIAQVMQPANSALLAFETAPYWNIPTRKRINICVPRERIGIRPLPCNGQHILQGVGRIALAEKNAAGVRTGYGNVLDANGIITSTAGVATNCAAWTGTLWLQGCLSNIDVRYYTLEHFQPGRGWQPLAHEFTLEKNVGIFRVQGQIFEGIDSLGRAIYLNAETDSQDWLSNFKGVKAKIPSGMFLENGPREIRIKGLNASRVEIPGIEETITLFILNNGIDLDIRPEVSMDGGITISDCGLFTLPAGVENPAIRVRFKANQLFAPPVYGSFGFMGAYQLWMEKGSTGGFATGPAGGSLPIGKAYVPLATGCDLSFRGTRDEATADAENYIQVGLVAVAPNTGWLEAGQTFCAFSLNLSGHLRRTDGNSANWESRAEPVLFGIQR